MRGAGEVTRRACGAAALILSACLLLASAAGAKAEPGMFVGVGEDTLKSRPQDAVAIAHDLGLRAFRITLSWHLGQTQLQDTDRRLLRAAVDGRADMRLLLAIYSQTHAAPVTAVEQGNYCTYVRNVIDEFPEIGDVIIWNEPNLGTFWWPQFNEDGSSAAPGAYEALLARCYDVLHAAHPGINVIAPATSLWGNDNPRAITNVSHSPVNFIREMGRAYRASGRERPIFDTFGHHPHPGDTSERPWKVHSGTQVSEGDLDKLIDVLRDEFFGTAQPVPGNGLSIWYLEDGYQTKTDGHSLYWGLETWPHTLPDYVGGEPESPRPSADSPAPDQYTQLIDAIRLAYCQPYVGAYFNFLLWDERDLARWQSGVFWADGTPKRSYEGLKQVVHEVNSGTVDCGELKGGAVAAPAPLPGGSSWESGAPAHTAAGADATRQTRLRYTGTRVGAFGFVTLRARLTAANGAPLARRRVVFGLPGMKLTAASNARGVAVAHTRLPLRPGGRYVDVRFGGDARFDATWARVYVNVLNSRANVRTKRSLRLRRGARTVFRISAHGRKVSGMFTFRSRSVHLVAAHIDALGVGPHRRSAWFAGRTTHGRRFFAYVRKRRHGGARFQLWVSGGCRTGEGRVVRGRVVIRGAA